MTTETELNLGEIGELIAGHIPEQFEDERQDAWVRVLESRPNNSSQVVTIVVHGLVKVFSDDTAKSMLEQFLAQGHKGTKIVRLLSVQKWEYTEEPFWAIVVELFGIYLTGIYGFHVHVDGEVVMVGKQPRELRKHEDTGC